MAWIIDKETGERRFEQDQAESTQSPLDLAAIDSMPEAELRALCKRMACQCGLIARMTREETAQAMLDTLAETALKPIVMGLNMRADIQSRLSAIDRWLDRTEGKPTQRIEQKVQHLGKAMASDMTTDELMIAVRQLADMKLLPAGVTMLPDGKLDVIDASYVTVEDGEHKM